jgi:hypothetical protein
MAEEKKKNNIKQELYLLYRIFIVAEWKLISIFNKKNEMIFSFIMFIIKL